MQNQKTQKQSMSKQSMSKQSTPKPFCKVCYDAGKTSAEYSTHYVRESRGGAVICPTLLSQECKYCKKIGHTPSHCPVLLVKAQAKQVQSPAQAQQSQVQAPAKPTQAPTKEESQTRAARLCESPPPQNEKPVFVMKTWASAVSKKAEPVQAQARPKEEQAPAAQAPAPAAQAPAAEAPAFNYFNISWADVE
jgi:hypothetical protein